LTDFADVPDDVVDRLRSVCMALPEAYEEQPMVGTRWRIRKRTFAHALATDSDDGPQMMIVFRSSGPELDMLLRTGHPFFPSRTVANVVGMVLETPIDWDELAELVTESYCLLAPKKLVALVDRPDE
jgi:predicted DNA-binding protein (MmcQ/YjbR family)